MTSRQAGHVLSALRRRSYDAWAGPTDPAITKSNVVTIGFNAELHRDDFAWLVKFAEGANLDLSWGVGNKRVLVLS